MLLGGEVISYLILFFLLLTIIINFEGTFIQNVKGQSSEKGEKEKEKEEDNSIIIHDPRFKAKLVVSGLDFPTNSNRISNAASGESIISGIHTVIALDNTTGCQDSLTIHLPYSDEAALLSILTTPQTDCLAPDGGFDATITPSAGTIAANPGVDQTWYELRVYQNGALIATAPGAGPPTTMSERP